MRVFGRFTAFVWILFALVPSAHAQAPPLVGHVSFDDIPVGAGIAKNRYASQGVLLNCTPDHWLYSAASGTIRISPGGSGLWMSFEFIDAATGFPGTLQRTDLSVQFIGSRHAALFCRRACCLADHIGEPGNFYMFW